MTRVYDSAQADTRARFQFDGTQPTSRSSECGFTGERRQVRHYGLDFVEFETAPDRLTEDNAYQYCF